MEALAQGTGTPMQHAVPTFACCATVSPRTIPWTDPWERIGRATTLYMIEKLFDG